MKKRKYLTPKQKATLVSKQSGMCAECGDIFTEDDPPDFDHHLALIDGGTNALKNWRAIHRVKCHRPKSIKEHKANAKVKRIIKKRKGIKSKWVKKIPSRPFRRPM